MPTQLSLRSILLALLFAAPLFLNPWMANAANKDASGECKDEMANLDPKLVAKRVDVQKKIGDLKKEIQATLPPNKYNATLPALDTPTDVMNVVNKVFSELKKSEKDLGFRPEGARDAILEALELLYTGRGNTIPKDGRGWYLASRSGATGLPEISMILSSGILDGPGLKRFENFVINHDFDSGTVKRRIGFPAEFEVNRPDIRDQVLTMISRAPVGKPFDAHHGDLSEDIKVAEDIMDFIRKRGGPEGGAAKLLFDSEKIKSGKPFTPYFGRDEEANQILDVLSRGQKQHFLMAGKAGVGKTTIMKLVQQRFLKGQSKVWDEKPAIIIELPITLLTNSQDPTAIRIFLQAAVEASQKMDRRVILFADEAHVTTTLTQNAMKAFLTEVIENIPTTAKVNVALATTSGESRKLEDDSAFMGRFAVIHVPEFNREQIIELIKKSNIPKWKQDHKKAGYYFDGQVSDEAFEYAYRYRYQEQRHRETGTWELLEGAITSKMNRDTDSARTKNPKKGAFSIDVADVQLYLREKFRMDLIPGDPNFEANFSKKWTAFEQDYAGNDGAKAVLRGKLRSHFGQLIRNKLTAIVAFGPPGAGKSYGAEKLAQYFFGGAMVTTNGAEFKNGGLELNKLIGSPPGTVGSEERRAILTQAIKEHPNGFVWKIEEADYLHQDIIQFMTNLISDKKFTDGLGKEWHVDNIIIWANSNVGQGEMIPTDSGNRMNWDQYAIRRNSLTERRLVDGKIVEVVRPNKIEKIFDQFIETVVTKSHPDGDSADVAQEANKQKRRFEPLYILPPNKDELVQAAHQRVKNFVDAAKAEYGLSILIPEKSVELAIDLDHYQFEKGYSYVIDQLQRKIFDAIVPYMHLRGKSIKAEVEPSTTTVNGRTVPSQNLRLLVSGEAKEVVINLGAVDNHEQNPWGSSPEIMKRIQNFPVEIRKFIKGNSPVIQGMARALKDKAFNWNKMVVFSFLGTSGNGKTETAKALAKVLYGTEEAMFKITGVDHPWDLSDYFRPPTGIVGSNKETPFEKWFKSRQTAGGGVMLFDELLSEIGNKGNVHVEGRKGGKIEVLRELYELLDEGKLKLGGKIYDAKAFVVILTGNALQEFFKGIDDTPEAEQLVQKILGKLTPDVVVKSLEEKGLDAPLIARLGQIFVLGPQPKTVSVDVGKMKIEKAVHEIQGVLTHPVQITIDPSTIEAVVSRLTTVRLGMRAVDRGFEKFILMPLRGIIQDIDSIRPLKSIEMHLKNGEPIWIVTYVEGGKAEVCLEGYSLGDGLFAENWKDKKEFDKKSENRTPQLKDLETIQKLKMSPELVHSTTVHEVYGHYMVDAILNHKNGADFISIIPGENYLGYVRPKEVEVHTDRTLLTLMKEAAVLDAGHRASFKMGLFATGGGNGGPREKDDQAQDDLGKLYKNVDIMIHNNLLSDVNEYSSEAQKRVFKQFVEKVSSFVADQVIDMGMKSGQFTEIFDRVLKNRYATQADLDSYIQQKVDFSKFGNPDVLYAHYMVQGVVRLIRSFPMLKDSIHELAERIIVESEARNAGNEEVLSQLAQIRSYVENELEAVGHK